MDKLENQVLLAVMAHLDHLEQMDHPVYLASRDLLDPRESLARMVHLVPQAHRAQMVCRAHPVLLVHLAAREIGAVMVFLEREVHRETLENQAHKGCLVLTALMERMVPRAHLVFRVIPDRLVFLERGVPRELVASQVILENLARKVLLESPESLV